MNELPLSLRLLREMHAILLEGVRGQNRAPGEFRKVQNWIGPPGTPIHEARYVPPPPGYVLDALSDLERFLHIDHNLPPLVEMALVHYQFEAIHPFLDGNGRIGRLLITLMFLSRGLLPEPALYLSAYFERHRNRYYNLLLAVSQTSAWNEWITFFLEGVRTEARDAVAKARSLVSLREAWRELYQREGRTTHLLTLVDHLLEQPVVTVPHVAKKLGVTHAWANRLVERLSMDGILERLTPGRRNRLFAAQKVLEILGD